jgi:hypothetical protein
MRARDEGAFIKHKTLTPSALAEKQGCVFATAVCVLKYTQKSCITIMAAAGSITDLQHDGRADAEEEAMRRG